MTHGNHIRFSLAIWLAVATTLHLPFNPTTVLYATLGALAPDLDHPQSLFGQRVRWFGRFIRTFSQHRGITHSALWFALLITTTVVYRLHADTTEPHWTTPFLVGYATGILGDLITSGGVQLGWPSHRWWRTPRALRWNAGSWQELTFVYLCLAISLYYASAAGQLWSDLADWTHDTHGTLLDTGSKLLALWPE